MIRVEGTTDLKIMLVVTWARITDTLVLGGVRSNELLLPVASSVLSNAA